MEEQLTKAEVEALEVLDRLKEQTVEKLQQYEQQINAAQDAGEETRPLHSLRHKARLRLNKIEELKDIRNKMIQDRLNSDGDQSWMYK